MRQALRTAVRATDNFQRKHPVVGFPIAVIYKYFDDQGPYLGAIIAYYSFVAVFPLLLIGSSILGFFLQGNAELQDRLLDTALAQFPIVGDQLGRPEGLKGSASAIVVGSLAAAYGCLGVGQSTQNASNVAWAVPRNSRPNPIIIRLRSLVLLGMAGSGILLITVVQVLIDNSHIFGDPASNPNISRLVRLLGIALTVGIFAAVFKFVSLRRARWIDVLPGAVFCALGWALLQIVGNVFVDMVVVRVSTMNRTFALVLGLIVFLWAFAAVIILGLQVNVVGRRRLYPRALLTPFSDRVSLTDGDRRAYRQYARSQRYKGFQTIDVSFDRTDLPAIATGKTGQSTSGGKEPPPATEPTDPPTTPNSDQPSPPA